MPPSAIVGVEIRAGNRKRRRVGVKAIVLSSVGGAPERVAERLQETYRLRNAIDSADAAGILPIVAIYSFRRRHAAQCRRPRQPFASYAAALVRSIPELRYVSLGNEPNSNLFWMPPVRPRRNRRRGKQLLVRAARDRGIGPSRGSRRRSRCSAARWPRAAMTDRTGFARRTRRRGSSRTSARLSAGAGSRSLPSICFSIHPYPANSSIPPTAADPRLDRDRDCRLLETRPIAQGSIRKAAADRLRRVRDPDPRSRGPSSTSTPGFVPPRSGRSVSAARLTTTSRRFTWLPAQPLVKMLIFFHVTDESDFTGLQTGLYYPNGTPKRSLARVAASAQSAENGQGYRCAA